MRVWPANNAKYNITKNCVAVIDLSQTTRWRRLQFRFRFRKHTHWFTVKRGRGMVREKEAECERTSDGYSMAKWLSSFLHVREMNQSKVRSQNHRAWTDFRSQGLQQDLEEFKYSSQFQRVHSNYLKKQHQKQKLIERRKLNRDRERERRDNFPMHIWYCSGTVLSFGDQYRYN